MPFEGSLLRSNKHSGDMKLCVCCAYALAPIAICRADASGGNQHDHWLTALMLRKSLA